MMPDYGPLFRRPEIVEPARENNPDRENLRALAADWIGKNPGVVALFMKYAKELQNMGRPFGVKLVAERVRYECLLTNGDGYRINNNLTAYVARHLIALDPELERFLHFRETKY